MNEATDATCSVLDEYASKKLLAKYGVATPNSILLPAGVSINNDLHGLTPPLALKLIAPGVLHKSDIGGVKLDLVDAAAVHAAMREMSRAPGICGRLITGYLVEEMAPRGYEVVVGGLIDARFGPVIMAGLGGIFVEVFADVAFRVCPITTRDANDMIRGLRGAALLLGARGGIKAAMGSLIDALVRIGGVGGLLMDLGPKLREVDVNPLIVSGHSAIAVDARILLA